MAAVLRSISSGQLEDETVKTRRGVQQFVFRALFESQRRKRVFIPFKQRVSRIAVELTAQAGFPGGNHLPVDTRVIGDSSNPGVRTPHVEPGVWKNPVFVQKP